MFAILLPAGRRYFLSPPLRFFFSRFSIFRRHIAALRLHLIAFADYVFRVSRHARAYAADAAAAYVDALHITLIFADAAAFAAASLTLI